MQANGHLVAKPDDQDIAFLGTTSKNSTCWVRRIGLLLASTFGLRGSGEPSCPEIALGAFVILLLVLLFVSALVSGGTVPAKPRTDST